MKGYLFASFLMVFAIAACAGENITPNPTLQATSNPINAITSTPIPGAVIIDATVLAATQQAQPGLTDPLQKQFEEIDKSLSESMKSSIAYNVPAAMKLDDNATIELLLNPSQSPSQLGTQVTEGGKVVTATIEITPFMKAELLSADPEAFGIQPMLDNPIQPIGTNSITKWEWVVTAKKAGQQKLTMVISRLVRAQGQDYWTIIQTYKSDIEVRVTIAQCLESLDWKWIVGIILTALVIPAFWRWNDRRKKQTDQPAKPKQPKKREG